MMEFELNFMKLHHSDITIFQKVSTQLYSTWFTCGKDQRNRNHNGKIVLNEIADDCQNVDDFYSETESSSVGFFKTSQN